MNIRQADKIARIVELRRPLVQRIQQVETNLKSLDSAIYELESYRLHCLNTVDDPQFKGQLQSLEFSRLGHKITEQLSQLKRLKSRFSRNTINLGVVGRAGQGKSRLLQSLSGLTSQEIPTGDRQHCTGVRSTIYHHLTEETYGEIFFHSELYFIDQVISPYYQKLELGLRPTSLEEFATQPLPPLPLHHQNKAEYGAMYEHLRCYQTHLEQYRHLFNEHSPKRISQEEIRAYIAQDNEQGERIYFNYLAVREAKINCTFPNPDVGKIALIDMPGLGDTGLGDEERLIKILGQDVDFVLFIRLPRPPRDYWADVDVKLYDIASSALKELPLKLWSFLILNQTNANSLVGDNLAYCQDLKQSYLDKHIDVKDCIIADCSDSQEVQVKILDPVLDYLTKEIQSLDHQYTTICQNELIDLHTNIRNELNKARLALGQSTIQETEFPLFVELFNQLWSDLTNGLEALLKDLEEQRHCQDEDFLEQVEAALQACREDTGIPSEEEIEKRRNQVGGYPNVYYKYLNEVRAHLSQHFLSLDEGLKRSLDKVKTQVANVLIEPSNLGGLSDKNGVDFLEFVADIIPENLLLDTPSELKRGFQILASFELSYRGLIQHRIRQHLDDLMPDKTELQLSPSPSAQEVLTCLTSLQAEAVYRCQTALDDLMAEPSQAGFSIVEEFLDRVLRAKNVKDEWFIFLESVRHEIWPEKFEQLGERTRNRKTWIELIDKVENANQVSHLKFLD